MKKKHSYASFSNRVSGSSIIKSPAGASTILPTDLPNLNLWLKADAITGKSDGDPISSWLDSSVAGNNATQAAGGLQPIYKTNILNGKPVVRFDATDDGLTTTLNIAGASQYSIFIVYALRNAGSVQRRALNGVDFAGSNWLIGPYLGKHDFYDGGFRSAPPSVTQNVFVRVSLSVGAVNSLFYVNGTLNQTAANGGKWPTFLSLGCSAGAAADPSECDVAEVIGYGDAKNSTDVASINAYLSSKYAI